MPIRKVPVNYRLWWAVLFVCLAIWLVPTFFWMAGGLFNEVAATTSDVVGESYDVVTDAQEPYAGPTHIVEVTVTFDVNPGYHGWGQLLASYHQLPEISGRVFAARMLPDEERVTLQDAGLLSQLRLNWRSSTRMEWTDVRVRAPQYHLPIGGRSGWWLCVDLHEASEGHNILGGIQDGLHFVHADLSTGDQAVAAECVRLDNNSFPYDYTRRAMYRPGETVPAGWLTVRYEGSAG